ncbi:hypothetical protein IH86_21770 [Sphingobium yanoikuyae]|jgi:hypothetical protein|uniref:Uncharacterized protein n=2 Tax=Sphingobium yanoikuyae TaxID=13690 RepID=K9D7V3_SPHYA|nr:hypothetical protein BV87_01635 [Sphingobium yanoikuyae]EKU74982.1 hypothetical protein HMPREF9718_02510 [Sphingobium yanoikuyae ATCC 51230]PHP19381.1 hypothetical protein CG471_12610 [Sphingobium sp. IP1]TKV40696.1 hypothetical protein A0U87_23495 [Sphingobium sp. MP9-4]SCW75903.1 hypothetical protein SAMN02927924_02639 [Sphingobium faniae]
MRYRLLRDDDRSVATTSEDLEGELAATTWARAWLEDHADHDRYRLEPMGGSRPMLMIRTVAGHGTLFRLLQRRNAPELAERRANFASGRGTTLFVDRAER